MEYSSKLRFAVSCSSNMNRSMEAHSILKWVLIQNVIFQPNSFRKRGFNIESYGSGNQVKMPGPTVDRPNCYEFGPTTYEDIYADLTNKDLHLLVAKLKVICVKNFFQVHAKRSSVHGWPKQTDQVPPTAVSIGDTRVRRRSMFRRTSLWSSKLNFHYSTL